MSALQSVLVASVLCAVFGARSATEGEAQTITTGEARRLVYQALPAEARRLPGLTLHLDDGRDKRRWCAVFDVLWANPGLGSVHVAFYSVDMRTAEVWKPVACEHATNPSVRRLQRAIRKRLGVTEAELRAALARNPCCSRDQFSGREGARPRDNPGIRGQNPGRVP
jgi:hypothetical protein